MRHGGGGSSGPPTKRQRHFKDAGRTTNGVLPNGTPWDSGVPQTAHAFKALCSEELVKLLLGSRGAVKDQIQNDTCTKLVFSNRHDHFPPSSLRVLGIYADDPLAMRAAFEQVVERMVQGGGSEHVGKEPGEYAFRLLLTRKMASDVIGAGGANVQRIREETGAKIFIENEVSMGHRMARVIGTPDVISLALVLVNDCVQFDCQDPSFAPYAGVVNFGDKDPAMLDLLFPATGGGGGCGAPVGQGPQPGGGPPPGGRGGCKAGGKGHAHKGGSGAAADGLHSVPVNHVPRRVPARVVADGAVGADCGASGFGQVPHRDGSAPDELCVVHAPGVDRLSGTLSGFPQGTTECAYSVDCLMNVAVISQLESRAHGRSDLDNVQEEVKVTINQDDNIEQMEDGEELRRISVVGPLPNIYVAHAKLQVRVHALLLEWRRQEDQQRQEAEAAAAAAAMLGTTCLAQIIDPVEAEDPEAIKQRIAELQSQLYAAEARKAAAQGS